jgi:uncharacterized protein YbaP (TraB family)
MNDGNRRRLTAGVFGAWIALVAAAAGADPALWEVKGRVNTVYLFGSVHLLPEGGFTVRGALSEALDEAERVCLELDPDAQSDAEKTSITLARAIDPEGRNLFDLLGDDADRVRERAGAAGVDLEPFAAFEPWFAGVTVTVMALQSHGFDVEHGVEQIIGAAANEAGKDSCGLETFDGQLGLLDSLPAELQKEVLLQAIDEADDVEAIIGPMLDAWREGDESGLEDSLDEDFEDYPELAEALIFKRNRNWAAQVGKMLEGGDDVLLVVGAMHLVGPRGLPALLEKRGFSVDRR